jgi:hypothetical protein
MPYEISFTKQLSISDRDQYINECCIGGDVVVNQLLPQIRERYTEIQTNQEDWGWFIWFRQGKAALAIDVFTEDPQQGFFRIHLTSRLKRLFVVNSVVDTAELEELRALVESELTAWGGRAITVIALDSNYIEIDQ